MGDHARALNVAEQLLAEDASLSQVFFYGEAVKLAVPTSHQLALQQRWLTLQQQYQLALWLCHDAALDWGVVAEGGRETLEPGFMLGSLGQFAEGCYHSDYVLSFGVQDDS
jgi:tRNA 2-thiouridine synthesizing protein D